MTITIPLQVPPLLTQQYLFVPSRIKTCYLIAFLQYISKRTENEEEAKSGVSSQIREVLSDEKNKVRCINELILSSVIMSAEQ